ncbi:unnamed protein product [Rodentolepis nana]|uniref:WD_REPEATS_REGION domain-containing protein n=1 Tax=Rodentolepis nana TaxID=102285 RepID=A0A0R3TE59_RODNA|nr:unnamed protein product [Rodentolepis nana]
MLRELGIGQGSEEAVGRPTCITFFNSRPDPTNSTQCLVSTSTGWLALVDVETGKVVNKAPPATESPTGGPATDSEFGSDPFTTQAAPIDTNAITYPKAEWGPRGIHSVAMYQTFSLAITGHEDRCIRFYDLTRQSGNADKACVATVVTHLEAVTCLTVDPHDLYVLTGSKSLNGFDNCISQEVLALVSFSASFTSGGSSPFPPVGYRSDGSSPFPHVGYIWWVFSVSSCRSHRQVGLLHFLLCFARQPCPVRCLNSATASVLGQSAMSESVTVHCFSFVRALSSLHLEIWNSLLIKAFIVWKDIGWSVFLTLGVDKRPLIQADFFCIVSLVLRTYIPIALFPFSKGHDASIRLWDLESRACVQEMTCHRVKNNESIHAVAMHPTMPFAASAGADAMCKVYTSL